MVYYILFEILFIYLLIIERKYKKFVLIIILLGLTFFLATKEPTYYDLINYYNMYNRVSLENISIYPEIGFIFIASILKKIGLSFYSLTFVFYGLMFYFLYKGIKNLTKYYEWAFFIFILFPIFFLSDYIALRQALAISLFFYTISLWIKRKKSFKFFLFISIFFHYSVILAYLIFFFVKSFLYKRFNFYFYLLLIILSVVMGFFIKDSLFYVLKNIPILCNYSHYLLKNTEFNLLRTIVYISIYFLILFLFLNSKNNYILNILFNLYTIGMFITLIGKSDMNVNRFANYFMIFIIVLIPNLFLLKNNYIPYKIRVFILGILLIFLSYYYYYGIIKIPEVFLTYRNVCLKDLF